MGRLEGKVALITGGTSGIGAATARLFHAEGASVIVTGSSAASVEAAKADLPAEVEAVVSDAASVAATQALVELVTARHGRIDVLFVNAGIGKFAAIDKVEEADFDHQFAVNVKGPFFLMKHALPVMPDGAAIILTSSVGGASGGMPGGTVYGATKAALRSFGRTFAKDLAARTIRVNTISPGPTLTAIFDKDGFSPALKQAFLEGAKTRIPLGRPGRPEEVAAAALYLAADATFTTGAELFVDGGRVDI